MRETILVTGGCGFIGRHVCRAALKRGYNVRVLDALIDQVHGKARNAVDRLDREVEVLEGDVRDPSAVRNALTGVDCLVHLAAEVGVGQSMYEIARYVGVNDYGTSVVFDGLAQSPVRRVVTASSMSIYGEGLYRDASGVLAEPDIGKPRTAPNWNPTARDGRPLEPEATPETKPPVLASVYALTKFVQERLTLIVSHAYGMEGCALRLFNVFGPGQALSNPYTGVLAIFASRLANRKSPLVFEDGRQLRDFVHVEDAAEAFMLALEKPKAAGGVFNIGSGERIDIGTVATRLAHAMGRSEIKPTILEKMRVGDIRHCYADISLAREALGYEPRHPMNETTLSDLADWVSQQQADDLSSRAHKELETRGLIA